MPPVPPSLDELIRLLDEVREAPGADTVVTSTRMPLALREAVRQAVRLGMDAHANEAVNLALRDRLEAFAEQAALDEHYRLHPGVKPSLADVAQALAEIDHNPIAESPALIKQAAGEVAVVKPDADADDVLIWAASLRAHQAAPATRRSPNQKSK